MGSSNCGAASHWTTDRRGPPVKISGDHVEDSPFFLPSGEILVRSNENGKNYLVAEKQDGSGRCPSLVGLYRKHVQLADGRVITADDAYIRESILQPDSKVVAGFQPLMPTFQGLVTEEGVVQLIEYIKSLSPKPGTGPAPANISTPDGEFKSVPQVVAPPSSGSTVPKNR